MTRDVFFELAREAYGLGISAGHDMTPAHRSKAEWDEWEAEVIREHFEMRGFLPALGGQANA